MEPRTEAIRNLSPEQQLRRACAELEERLRAGEACRAEEFIAALPGMTPEVEGVLDLIYTEYLMRLEMGQQAVTEEFYGRFPQWRERLRQQFELHEWLRNGEASELSGSPRPAATRSPVSPAGTTGGSWPRHYEILEEIGRGGMGVVYKARQVSLGRLVALKMILAGAQAGPDELARFRAEAEAVARLQHPNIVQIYEVGEQDGKPFLALEFVVGGSLEEKLAGAPQPGRPSAQLLETLARAVHVAHEQGIVHRDLKPANVLLSRDGTPKITDFGLAKRLNVEATGPTLSGDIVGTPSYMAPEQALGRPGGIGPAVDVYALGAILYEMVTGRPPFDGTSAWDTIALVLGTDPVSPARLQPSVPRDLETVCLKCLEKEPGKRYVSANDLADDLHRFLNGEPIRARPVGTWERGVKWGKRRPAIAALLALTVLVASVGLLGVLWQWRQAVVARGDAEDSARAEIEARRKTDEALAESQRNLYFSRIALAEREWSAAHAGQVRDLLAQCPTELRHFEWRYLQRQCHSALLTLHGHAGPVRSVAYRGDGRQLASAGDDGTIKLWKADSGQEVRTLRGHSGVVWSVAYSPDGRQLASAGADGSVKLWDATTGKEQHSLRGHSGAARCVVYRPDGRQLASSGDGGTVLVREADTGKEIRKLSELPRCMVFSVAYSSDGRLLALALEDGTVRVWEADGHEVHSFKGHNRWVTSVAFDRDGKRLASAGIDQTVRLWALPPGTTVAGFGGHIDAVYAVGFDPVSRRLVSAGRDQTLRVWLGTTGRADSYRGHSGPITGLAVLAHGGRVATASQDGTIKVWDVTVNQEAHRLLGHTDYVGGVAWRRDGLQLATAGLDHTVRLWDAATRKQVRTLSPPVAAKLRDQSIPFHYAHAVGSVAYRPDGRQLASATAEKVVYLWDVASGKLVHALEGHAGLVRGVAYSPDGRYLASCSEDQTVKIWDPATGRVVRTLTGHTHMVYSVAYHPHGRHLASAGRDGTIRIWDATTGEAIRTQRGHGQVYAVTYSLDGRWLASAGEDTRVTLWDAATGQAVRTLAGHADPVLRVAFSADGRRLASASVDRTVRIWDVNTGQELLTLLGHLQWVQAVAFSPDDRRLASVSHDLTVRIWEAMPSSAMPPGKLN